MVNYIKKDKPVFLLFLVLITVALWLNDIIYPHFTSGVFEQNPMPLYQLLLFIPHQDSWWMMIGLVVVVLFQGFVYNQINAKFRLIEEGTYLPGILFVLIISSIHQLHCMNPVYFANIFLLYCIHQLFGTYKMEKVVDPFFNSAFLLSIGSLFYFPMIFFAIVLIYFMLSSRSFYWREWVGALIGFCTPYLLSFSVYFVLNKTQMLANTMSNQLSYSCLNGTVHFQYLALFAYCSLIMFVSMIFLYRKVLKKVSIRKFYGMFLFIWFVSVFLYLLIPSTTAETVFFFSIPIAYFLPNYLFRVKSKITQRSILLGLIFFLIIANYT